MICMVLNTILYMDGDVKNKTIEQLPLSLDTERLVCPLVSPLLQPHQQCLYHACKCVHPRDVVYERPC